MENMKINNPGALFKAFNLSNKYMEYMSLDKASPNIAFRVLREYPNNISYKPPLTKPGIPDNYAHFQVIYEKKKSNDNKTPLTIIVSNYSKYRHSKKDSVGYDFSDPNCPITEESYKRSKSNPQPIYLECEGKYYYDDKTRELKDRNSKTVTGENILKSRFNIHIRKGIPIKYHLLKMIWYESFKNIYIWSLENLFGRKVKTRNPWEEITEHNKEKSLEYTCESAPEEIGTFKIFDYKFPSAVVRLACFIVVILFMLKANKLFAILRDNSILLTSLVILSLWFLNEIAYKIILNRINALDKHLWEAQNKLPNL